MVTKWSAIISMMLWFIVEGLYITPLVQFVLPDSVMPVLELFLLPLRILLPFSISIVIFLAVKENKDRKKGTKKYKSQ